MGRQAMLGLRGAFGLVLVWTGLILSPARAAEWFVDASGPAGNGAADSPFNSLLVLPVVVASGDSVHIRGEFHGQRISFINLTDTTLTGWPGEGQRPVIRGDTLIDAAAWSLDGRVGAFVVRLSEPPIRMVCNWDQNVDAQGRHYGFLRGATSLSSLQPGEWWGDGTGRIYMRPPPNAHSADPRDGLDRYSWIRRGDAVRFQDGERITVRGLDFALWAYADETDAGYGVRISGGTDCIIEDCGFTDMGKHAAGVVGAGATNCAMRRITSRGLDAFAVPSAGHLVFYSYLHDIIGASASDCELRLYTSLDYNGQSMGGGCNGVFVHAAYDAVVRGVVFRRIHCVEFEGNYESALGLGPATSLPADRASTNPEDYPVRFIECSVENGARMFFADGAGAQAAAFERCRFAFPRAGSLGQYWTIRIQGTDARALFESCVISADGSRSLVEEPRLFDVPSESSLMLCGCTVHVAGALGRNCALFRQNLVTDAAGYPNALVAGSQNLFSRETPGCLHRGNSGASAESLTGSIQLRDCWTWNIDPAQFSLGNPLIGNEQSWRRLIDPMGVYGTAPGYTSEATGDFSGQPGSALRTMTSPVPGVTRLGIDRTAYRGSYGAFQYGLVGDLNNDGVIAGADLARLLGAWGACAGTADPCPDDLNGDGVIDSADVAALLGNWSIPAARDLLDELSSPETPDSRFRSAPPPRHRNRAAERE